MKLLKRLTRSSMKLNKKRTVVTMVGVILAVALLTTVSVMVLCFRQSLINFQKDVSGDYHYIFRNVNEDNMDKFLDNRNFEKTALVSEEGFAKYDNIANESKPYLYVAGTDKEGFSTLNPNMVEGRLPEKDDELVIPRHLRTNGRVDLKVGDTVTLDLGTRVTDTEQDPEFPFKQRNPLTEDEHIEDTQTKTYTIVGIMERPGYNVEDYEFPGYTCYTYCDDMEKASTVYVRLTSKALRHRDSVIAGIMEVDENLYKKIMFGDGTDPSEEDFKEYCKQYEATGMDVETNIWLIEYESVWPISDTFKAVYELAAAVMIIIIITSVCCIKNSFEISVTEKVKQYGMLISVGATRKQIRGSVLYEGFLLGLVGIPGGVALGCLASFILVKICNTLLDGMLNTVVVYNFSVWAIVLAALLGCITIFFSANGSARKATKISPVSAIRNQAEIKNNKKLKTSKMVKKLFGVGGVVAHKAIKRNKRKYRTVALAIIICTVAFIAISSFTSLAFKTTKVAYGDRDYNVSLYYTPKNVDGDPESMVEKLDNIQEIDKCKYYYGTVNEDNVNVLATDDGNDRVYILAIDDENYSKYIKSLGLTEQEVDGKAILINNKIEIVEVDNKMKKVEGEYFKVKAGDSINIDFGEYYGEKAGTNTLDLGICAITKERPLGWKNSSGAAIFVINNKTWNELDFADEKLVSHGIYMVSDNADLLQDNIEKMMNGLGCTSDDYNMDNVDASVKSMNSMFTLIAIFTYGLITVIALIGVTNIINTLNTSMQLRAREFATLRSIGMTNKEFNRMIRLECIFVGGKALIIAIPMGFLVSYGIYKILMNGVIEFAFNPPIIPAVISAVVVFALLMIIMKLSMTKINGKNIIETIKNENV